MRILITATWEAAQLDRLRQYGEVLYEPMRETKRLLAGSALVKKLDGVDIFVTEADPVNASVLSKVTTLQVLVSTRGTPVNVDIDAATRQGIVMLYTPGRNAEAVAELTLCAMVMLARRIPQLSRLLRENRSPGDEQQLLIKTHFGMQGSELWDKTVGIIGLGAVGQAVAARLVPFEMRLLAFDPYQRSETFSRFGARSVCLDELLRESDYVTLHAPITPETTGMMGAAQFALMKPTAFFLNLARAVLTDESALAETLRDLRIAGAAVDVYSEEPPPADHPLLQLDNVIALPHMGGNTAEVAIHQSRIATPDIEAVLRGERPRHCTNPAVLDGFRFRWTSDPTPPASPTHPLLEVRPMPAIRSKDTLDTLVRRWIQLLQADPQVASAIQDLNLCVGLDVDDVHAQYHLAFRGGKVAGAAGPDPAGATISLAMTSEVFDGLFSGQEDGAALAMSGKLAFSGDTTAGMGLMGAMDNLSSAYKAARAEVLGSPAAAPAQAAPAPSATPAVATASGSAVVEMAQQLLKQQIVDTVNELYAADIITAAGGNVSARLPGTDIIWITPTRMFKGNLKADDLIRVDLEGKMLEGRTRPSVEAPLHTGIMRQRPDVFAVVHTHSPFATGIGVCKTPLPPISMEAWLIGKLPVVPYTSSGEALAKAVLEAIGEWPGVFMQNHGMVTVAKDLRGAANFAQVIEHMAKVVAMARILSGDNLVTLPESATQALESRAAQIIRHLA